MNVIEEKYNWAYPLTRRNRTTLLVLHHEVDFKKTFKGGSGIQAQIDLLTTALNEVLFSVLPWLES